MRYLLSALLAFLVTAPLTTPASAKKPRVDHEDPVKVLEAVFTAARSKDPSALASLCDPEADNDGDTKRICTLTKDADGWDEFVTYFKKAKVSGEAVIVEDRATVPFTFGPDGTDKEEMRLIRRGDHWYLSSF